MNELKTDSLPFQEVFAKIHSLNQTEKNLLKNCYEMRFGDLSLRQYALYYSLAGNVCRSTIQKEFLLDMMAVYAKQDGAGHTPFEKILKSVFEEGNETEKWNINYLVDTTDSSIRIDYVLRYLDRMEQPERVDIPKLAQDILNWNWKTRTRWIRAIAGIQETKNTEEANYA